MKVTISYHPEGGGIKEIMTVEATQIATRDLHISGIREDTPDGAIAIYTRIKPSRIDRQGEIVAILGEKYVLDNPEPWQLMSDYALFGTPETIWRDEPPGETGR